MRHWGITLTALYLLDVIDLHIPPRLSRELKMGHYSHAYAIHMQMLPSPAIGAAQTTDTHPTRCRRQIPPQSDLMFAVSPTLESTTTSGRSLHSTYSSLVSRTS